MNRFIKPYSALKSVWERRHRRQKSLVTWQTQCIVGQTLTSSLTPSAKKKANQILRCDAYFSMVYLVSPYHAGINGEHIFGICEPCTWCSGVVERLAWHARVAEIDPRRQQSQNCVLIFPTFFRTGISKIIPPPEGYGLNSFTWSI